MAKQQKCLILKGKAIAELDNFVKDKNVGYIIIDSVYSPDEKPGYCY
jgi:hypothetical protein